MRAASVVIHFQYVPVFAVLTRAFTLLAANLVLAPLLYVLRMGALSILNNILAVVRSLCF